MREGRVSLLFFVAQLRWEVGVVVKWLNGMVLL